MQEKDPSCSAGPTGIPALLSHSSCSFLSRQSFTSPTPPDELWGLGPLLPIVLLSPIRKAFCRAVVANSDLPHQITQYTLHFLTLTLPTLGRRKRPAGAKLIRGG
jgi:hypothetical protein